MKYVKYLALIIITFLSFNICCYASNRVYDRTKEDYRVPSDVKVTSNNEEDILNTPSVNANDKVYDFANILSDKEEKKLYTKINDFSKNTGIESIILTTNSLNDYQISDYTYNFYDYNDFLNEGVTFTIYVNPATNKVSIFMGNSGGKNSRVFKVYDDENINSTLKYIYENYIVDGKYYEACSYYLNTTESLYVKVYGNYKVNSKGKVVTNIPWFYIFLLSLSISFIITVVLYEKFNIKVKKYVSPIRKSVDYGSIIVKQEYDKIVDKSKVDV